MFTANTFSCQSTTLEIRNQVATLQEMNKENPRNLTIFVDL